VTERPFEPGGYYHVGTRGNFGEPLFETPADHEIYLKRYARVATKYKWTTLDWCLLWNHSHFLVKLDDQGLSSGMQELNSWIARRLNAIHDQTGKGHAFRHRFSAEHVTTDGFRANLGLEYPRPFHSTRALLTLFANKPDIARRRYLEWVRAGHVSDGHDPSSNVGVTSAT
jgi:REP element-mobilizing transposase RayT